tara:strand:- start:2958 stop:3170 length:213 start_codon:yes stop_codon:yes gene_type:complete
MSLEDLLTKLIDGCAEEVLSQCAEDPSLNLSSAFVNMADDLPQLENMELAVKERALEIDIARRDETVNWP